MRYELLARGLQIKNGRASEGSCESPDLSTADRLRCAYGPSVHVQPLNRKGPWSLGQVYRKFPFVARLKDKELSALIS